MILRKAWRLLNIYKSSAFKICWELYTEHNFLKTHVI